MIFYLEVHVSNFIFNNFLVSTFFKGEQILSIIDKLQIDVACFGNHEFDFGIEHLSDLLKKVKYPINWIMSNLKFNLSENLNDNIFYHENINTNLENSIVKEYLIKDYIDENNNIVKVGFIGLIEKDWLYACLSLSSLDYKYENFIDCAIRIIKIFNYEKVDLIIVLSHMRENSVL